jgi:hypothetical protein
VSLLRPVDADNETIPPVRPPKQSKTSIPLLPPASLPQASAFSAPKAANLFPRGGADSWPAAAARPTASSRPAVTASFRPAVVLVRPSGGWGPVKKALNRTAFPAFYRLSSLPRKGHRQLHRAGGPVKRAFSNRPLFLYPEQQQ